MPRVQAYGPRRVELRPIAGGQRTTVPGPDSFGAVFGETATRLGLPILINQWTEERNNADQVAHLEAVNKLDAFTNDLLYNPSSGALQVKGKDSLDLANTVMPKYEETAGEIMNGLSNDRQKQAFHASVLQRQRDVSLTLMRHTAGEMQAYDQGETASAVKNAVNSAIANPLNPLEIQKGLATAEAVTIDHGKRAGWGPEELAMQLGAIRTSTHTGVIDGLLSRGQDKLARAYYEETKAQINGESQPNIEKALDAGSTLGESQRQADAIMKATTDEAAGLNQAKSIEDPKVRAATEELVHRYYTLAEEQRRQTAEHATIEAGNLIDANPALGVRAIPPRMWTTFTVPEKAGLEAYAKRNAPGEAVVKTDWGTYYGLMKEANEHPELFAKRNLMLSKGALANAEIKQLIEIQTTAREKKPIEPLLDGFRTIDDTLKGYLIGAGIDVRDKANDPVVEAFHELVNKQVVQLEGLTKKKADKTDIEKIAADVISRQILSSPTTMQSLFNLPRTPKRLIEATIDDVPPFMRGQIERALIGKKVPVTDQNILSMYKAQQLQQRPE
jgi:hypothetical protein